ncbi:CHASE2 domain-containing protein [Caenorhabditis elegans]|uniref:CHASE2 domain-containing protein n=1 Tax=Caenorhabditis elegans TaxID=6239 RepID=Q18440_CAEEL|nr:CHASE2 domain-containing protein [Caenorhabditis elegans]CCD66604.1 CHASE2 domain-containing protein [Caenorhabditis elegans]|eukprot:NP_501115.1 Uncharacterized protein CELE_C34D4.10 [Caenorhabditis elegans]
MNVYRKCPKKHLGKRLLLLSPFLILLIVMMGGIVFNTEEKQERYLTPEEQEAEFKSIIATVNFLFRQRKRDELQNVAIILKSTSLEDTNRWLFDIEAQRKSRNDLPLYIYPEINNLTEYKELKKLKLTFENVKILMVHNGSAVISDVLKNPLVGFLIEVNDTQHIGDDFGDFYYLGQEVMKLDRNVECVCGGISYQRPEYLQLSQDNIFWPVGVETCDIGIMRSRTDFKPLGSLDPLLDYPALAPICIRPEVPRISSDAEHVTNKSIGVNKFDAKLFTASKMNETVMLDLKAAKPMAMQDWNNLEKEDINGIYKFPFSGSEELSHYFGENDFQKILDQRGYDNIIPMFVHGRKVYIVPTTSM